MIRDFKASDLPVIADIGNRAWRGIHAMARERLGEELFRIIKPDTENCKGREIMDHASKHPEWILICEEAGRIVGFATFSIDGDMGEIGNNAVDPGCGLKGVGQQMYGAVMERMRQQGVKAVKVSTGLDEAHAPARRAYERAGFIKCLEHVTYYRPLR